MISSRGPMGNVWKKSPRRCIRCPRDGERQDEPQAPAQGTSNLRGEHHASPPSPCSRRPACSAVIPSRAPVSSAPPVLPRVALGEARAVRECIDRHGALVWSIARRLSPTPADAEDAAQEIFADLWKSAGRYRQEMGSEAVFVATIARRRLIDRLRARKRRPETEPISSSSPGGLLDPSKGGDGEVCAEASLAATAVAKLRPEQRQVLLLAVQQGLSHDEIATVLRMPLGTVKSLARRGLAHVRALLADPTGTLEAVKS
jgi:RNA polymerase sigma-70 factor (ECF subfamily)